MSTKKLGVVHIKLPEKFTVEEAVTTRRQIYDILAEGPAGFIIDFSQCRFIDSTGLGVLVSVYKRCLETGVQFELSSINSPKVMEVFRLTRLDQIFTIN